MSRFPDPLAALAALALAAGPASATEPRELGRAPTEAEIAAWDIDIRPDGQGLPEGAMSVADGEAVFAEKCAVCHGDFAEGVGRWPVLAGGRGTLTKARPVKTVGSYWPYLSTVWDYVNRAMPFGANLTLTPDEVYGVTAYILYMNDVVTDADFVLSRETLTGIELPNEDGFVDDPRPDTPVYQNAPACMENCKDAVEVTMHATVLDVTPDGLDGGESAGDGIADADASPTDAGEEVAATGSEAEAEEQRAEESRDPALVDAGAAVFRQCKACHMVGAEAKSRVGPHLNDVPGRPAGAVEGFRYSKAMQARAEEGLVWTPDALDAYLADPKGFVPGTRMSFRGLDDPADRAAVAAYLESASE